MSAGRIAVVGHEDGPAGRLAAALRAAGGTVDELRPAARAQLAAQLRTPAPPALLVWVPDPAGAAVRRPLTDLAPTDWDTLATQPLREGVACFQAAIDVLSTGAIVALLPTFAMTGSPGFTAWTTAAEGLRSLVKVTARELAPRGVTVNAVAVPAQLLAGSTGSLDRPGLPPARLPSPTGDGLTDVAGVVGALASPALRAVTGMTIGVDSGGWVPA